MVAYHFQQGSETCLSAAQILSLTIPRDITKSYLSRKTMKTKKGLHVKQVVIFGQNQVKTKQTKNFSTGRFERPLCDPFLDP